MGSWQLGAGRFLLKLINAGPFLLIGRGNWQTESKQDLAAIEYLGVHGCNLQFLRQASVLFLSFWGSVFSYQCVHVMAKSVRQKGNI